MIRIPVEDLPETEEFPFPILHESGEVLQEGGAPLTRNHVIAMSMAAIDHVYLVEETDDVFLSRRVLKSYRVPTKALTPSDEPEDPLLATSLDLPSAMRPLRFTDTTKRVLSLKGVRSVLVKKRPEQLRQWQVTTYRDLVSNQADLREAARREVERQAQQKPRPIPPIPPL